MELPATLADGRLKTQQGRNHNLLELPLHEKGEVLLTLEFFSDETLRIRGVSAEVVLHGEPEYVEDVVKFGNRHGRPIGWHAPAHCPPVVSTLDRSMNARELFERVVANWPAEVDISDRRGGQDGYWFPALAEVNRDLEQRIDYASDHWASIGSRSFYQAVVAYAREVFESGHRTLRPESLPLTLFDQWVRKNLAGEGWEKEAAAYE